MTIIDKISFRFVMADEKFAKELYADWDKFCKRCIIDTMDAFFSEYDTKDSYIEIDLIDLNLGGIAQENFYDEFPIRLKEALEQNLSLKKQGWKATASYQDTKKNQLQVFTDRKRFENLIHYLEYGFCLPEWNIKDFDLSEELLYFHEKDYMEKILNLVLEHPYIMERIFLQLDGKQTTNVFPFSVWLSATTLGQQKKRRFLSALLEHSPQSVIRFIHETGNTNYLNEMAKLVEAPSVKHIMVAETENHAEIDVPEYWYRLYGWLLKYYPFNGIPMFGDKQHFQLHLNRQLLSFIHKRTTPSYLSKAELTIQFLKEVFGTEHYIAILDILYYNQKLNPDGTPTTGDSYAWELYYIFLQLSLLKRNDKTSVNTLNHNSTSIIQKPETFSVPDIWKILADRNTSFGEWLENPELSDIAKRVWVQRIIRRNPDFVVRWLKDNSKKTYLMILADTADDSVITILSSQISLQLSETVATILELCDKLPLSVSWLKGINRKKLSKIMKTIILEGIGIGTFSTTDSIWKQVVWIAKQLYCKITGKSVVSKQDTVTSMLNPEKRTSYTIPIMEFINALTKDLPVLETTDNYPSNMVLPENSSDQEIIDTESFHILRRILSDRHFSKDTKKKMLLQWFDAYREREDVLISILLSEELLQKAINILDNTILRRIVMQMEETAYYSANILGPSSVIHFLDRLTENIIDIARILSRSVNDTWLSLFSWLVQRKHKITTTSKENSIETIRQLLVMLNDNKVPDINTITMIRIFINTSTYSPFPSDNRYAYTHSDIKMNPLTSWLTSSSDSDTAKSQMLRHYARWQPKQLILFIRQSVSKGNIPLREWKKWLGPDDWKEMLSGISFSLMETLRQTAKVLTEQYHFQESVLTDGFIQFFAVYPAENVYYGDTSFIIRQYIKKLKLSPDTEKGDKITESNDSLVKGVESVLHTAETEQTLKESTQPDYIEIPNAGLCLLVLWFPRLFKILGLLTDDGKNFINTESRIRAIFIIQHLVTDEKKEYKEQELAFNRILTECPFHIPLPKNIELTDMELQTVTSMLAGVKANWSKLKNTSVKGFQQSFINRPGKIEKQKDKWVLYVENRAYDILLNSLPWSYHEIRLPWLKKKIDVVWLEKESSNF